MGFALSSLANERIKQRMDFVFYDLETSGLSTAFDQPLQFAAIRADENLVERERFQLRCRLAPHILPSPEALSITGVTADMLYDDSLPSLFEFAQQLSELIENWAPAIWTGYNSMKFDEEVLRQTFYQNLQPDVYATQFNRNTRFDILSVVHAVHARAPDLLVWPSGTDGRASFRLDRLAPENGFETHNAHDALGDVEAAIHVARKIVRGNTELWAELLDNAHKSRVQTKLETFRPFELAGRFGDDERRSCVGCFCGNSSEIGTQAGFFDLDAADPGDLAAASDDKLAEAVSSAPPIIRTIATNKAPPLMAMREPGAERLRKSGIIANSPDFRRRVGAAMASRFAPNSDAPRPPVEKRIYRGFYTNKDKDLLHEFQRSDWPRRQEIVSSLSDPRLIQLGRRLIAFHRPQMLSSREAARFKTYLREKWKAGDESGPEWTTLEKARESIAKLRDKGSAEPKTLDAIATFVEARCAAAAG